MTTPFLETPIEYLKGVGPPRADLLRKELNIHTIGDLLTCFPFRYLDRSKFYQIADIKDDLSYIQLRAKIVHIQTIGTPHHQRLVATVRDSSGEIDLVWFQGIKWVLDMLTPQQEYVIFGKPGIFNGRWNIPHPELEIPSLQPLPLSEIIRPIYNSTEKLKSKGLDFKGIGKLVKSVLLNEKFVMPESLPPDIIQRLRLIGRQQAFINIHYPQSPELLAKSQTRLKFEELFYIQLRLAKQRYGRLQKHEGHKFLKIGDFVNQFYHHHLTFELTNAQKRVIREIRADLRSGNQMNRLLQGDVGSGKTLVALMTMLIALDNHFQGCMMAPTEILARQHFNTITGMLTGLNVVVKILTGSTRSAERRQIQDGLQDGTVHLLIGTHALIEENVKFKQLGLVVIDEQHRFGVAQRAKLWEKNVVTPHILVMTATPIPRTLAMTLYGDLDTSVIDEMPPGRKSIVTRHVYEPEQGKVFNFIRDKVLEGRQVYIVFPLIQESETLDLKNLEDGYQTIIREFPPPQYAVSMVHGKMKQKEKDGEMKRFVDNKTQIMVATTVIEVGVDVPNASVMVIENAERFGLSQLHQLRGRVGRGSDQSYCILMSSYELSSDARKRISTMVRTNDGFEIAETDLQLRGPGDLQGTQQSGIMDLRIADIVKDEKILKYARSVAGEIIANDPSLAKENNDILAQHLLNMDKKQQNWGLIS
jgi:ATP-dependent DNA helicase RecG